jgi:hypothetical protein
MKLQLLDESHENSIILEEEIEEPKKTGFLSYFGKP